MPTIAAGTDVITPPPLWVAETYLGRAVSGRSRALRLGCRRKVGDRDQEEFYVKSMGLPEITERSLFSEILGNLLARALGIVTAEPARIEITEAMAGLVRDASGARISPGVACGSRSLGAGLSPPLLGQMTGEQNEQAARIYLFDMLVQNPDRRPANENCVVVDGVIVAIDFAECFSFLLPIVGGTGEPWRVYPNLASSHLFRGTLSEQPPAEWSSLLEELKSVSDKRLSDLTGWIPSRWRQWATEVREHVASVRDHCGEFQQEILRSLL